MSVRAFDLNRPLPLAAVYFFFASLMIVISALLTPPGQIPDELNHLARSVQVSQGGFVGIRTSPQDTGGYLPTSLKTGTTGFKDIMFHPERKMTVAMLEAPAGVHWKSPPRFFFFANTVMYAPFTYMPGAAMVLIAQKLDRPVLETSYAVRFINGAVTIILCTLGIALARRGVLFLALVASMPMTLFLGASCSQDGIVIGLSILVAALVTRLDETSVWRRRGWIGLSIGFALLTVSRPPLLLCALIPLAFITRRNRYSAALPLAVSFATLLIWQVVGIAPVKIQMLPTLGVSDGGQIRWLLTHLTLIPGLAYRTLIHTAHTLMLEFIGVLGWLDTTLPQSFYRLVYFAVAACLLLSLEPLRDKAAPRQSVQCFAMTVIALLVACGGVFFALYVTWTKVGAPLVDGVQGRYFLPIAPFLAVIFPKVRTAGQVVASLKLHQAVVVASGVFLLIDTVTLGHVLASRYW